MQTGYKFPYGTFNFGTIRQEGYFYQDRTHLIPALEAAGKQQLFLRPRRFGKSLLISMLEHYYDLRRKDQFDSLFGTLVIGQNPTALHNSYLILHWDFSLVQSQGDTANGLCGFTEAELRAILHTLAAAEGVTWSVDDALLTMKTFYNGYRFSEWAEESLYNPTLSLYFLKHLQRYRRYPRPLLDQNLAMDRHRLAYVAGLPHGEDILIQALGDSDTLTIPELANRFGVEDMLKATKDHTFLVSLLYYLGVLTHAGTVGELEKMAFKIPNLVARSLYVERLREHHLASYEDRLELERVTEALFLRGDMAPVCDFLEQRLLPAFSNRDYR